MQKMSHSIMNTSGVGVDPFFSFIECNSVYEFGWYYYDFRIKFSTEIIFV